MKIASILAGLLIVASTTPAMAAGPYIGASLGPSVYHDSDLSVGGTGEIEYDAGIALTGNLGYNFDGIRLAGEFGYSKADVDTFRGFDVPEDAMDTSIYSYMANIYWDIKTPGILTPFLGGGVGLLHGRMTDSIGTYTDDVMGYQLMAGTGIRVAERLDVEVTYKYQAAAEDFRIGAYDVSFDSSNFLAGVRYNF